MNSALNFLYNYFFNYNVISNYIYENRVEALRFAFILSGVAIFTKCLGDQIVLSLLRQLPLNFLFLNSVFTMLVVVGVVLVFSLFLLAANAIFKKLLLPLRKVFTISLFPFSYLLVALPVGILTLFIFGHNYFSIVLYFIFVMFMFIKVFKKIYRDVRTFFNFDGGFSFLFIFIPLFFLFFSTVLLLGVFEFVSIWSI